MLMSLSSQVLSCWFGFSSFYSNDMSELIFVPFPLWCYGFLCHLCSVSMIGCPLGIFLNCNSHILIVLVQRDHWREYCPFFLLMLGVGGSWCEKLFLVGYNCPSKVILLLNFNNLPLFWCVGTVRNRWMIYWTYIMVCEFTELTR